jgi:hypothetical protein
MPNLPHRDEDVGGKMSWQNGSDIGVQFLLVGRDGIRMEVARVPLRVVAEYDYELVHVPATESSRFPWVQAASPPPPRVDGCPWYEAFSPGRNVPQWLQSSPSAADPYDGLAKLTRPSTESIVLDQQVVLDAQRERQVEFVRATPGDALGFPASGYPLPTEPVEVDFYAMCELAWSCQLQPGAWVAISFDRFEPVALSTAFLVKVADAWLFEPPAHARPKVPAAG